PTDVAIPAPAKNADRQSPIARDLETMTLSAYPIGAPGNASARGHSQVMEAEATAFGSPTTSVRRTGIIVGAVCAMAAAAAVAALLARPTQSIPVAAAITAAPSSALAGAAPPEPAPPAAPSPEPAPAALSAVWPTPASPATASQIHAVTLPRPSAIHRRRLKERRARESSRQASHALHAASVHPTMANSARSASPPPLAGNPYAAVGP
ncbi:MAG: hypothetical protein QOI66_2126, partial [Myxococcales bacterium]|nr:hypothetical protein [Myxococcales bacterium]